MLRISCVVTFKSLRTYTCIVNDGAGAGVQNPVQYNSLRKRTSRVKILQRVEVEPAEPQNVGRWS